MAVRIDARLRREVARDPGGIRIQVREAPDTAAAAAALEEARADIGDLDGGWESAPGLSPGDRNGPKFVSSVMWATTGPMLYVDGGHTPDDLLATIPDIVARRLAVHGVNDAVVGLPATVLEPLDLEAVPRAVYLRLYPPPPRRRYGRSRIPASWFEEATAWVTEGGAEPTGQMMAVPFPVAAEDLPALWERWRWNGSEVSVMTGSPESRLRAAGGLFLLPEPRLVLGFGGPGTDDQELLDAFHALVRIARRLASGVAYAYIHLAETLAGVVSIHAGSDLSRTGGADAHRVGWVCDELVFDAFPYQILGPGHLARLGWDGPLGPATNSLASGRVELSIGEPEGWLLGSANRDRLREDGRRALSPCLLPLREAAQIWHTRLDQNDE